MNFSEEYISKKRVVDLWYNKKLLEKNLTDKIYDRDVFMRSLYQSYIYEGLDTIKTEEIYKDKGDKF